MSESNIPELSEFEKSLRGLQPKCDAQMRDRLMYEAGRRANRPNRFWPATSGALAAALVASLWLRVPTQEPVMVAAPASDDSIVSQSAYLRTRNAVLRDGLGALPPAMPNTEQSNSILTPLSSRSREEV